MCLCVCIGTNSKDNFVFFISPMPIGDASGKNLHIEDEILQLENTNSVNQRSLIPIRSTFQRNLPVFKSDYQASRVNLVPFSQRNNGNAKRTSFSYTDLIRYHASQPKVKSASNPELTGENLHGKNRYSLQIVHQNPNALNFTRSQKSIKTNSADVIMNKEGLINGMYAPDVYSSGLVSKSKSEMSSDSSQPFNEADRRRNISVQPAIRSGYAERMYRNVNVNLDMRQKNNGSILYDNRNILPFTGQNAKMSRKVIPVSKSLVIVRANKKLHTPSPHASSAGITGISQISNDNLRPVGLSKVFASQPPATTAAMPKPQAFTKSHSDGIQSILPLKNAKLFSYQHDQVGQDYNRNVFPKASQQRNFESMNVTINAFKGFQHDSLRASQDAYQNGGRSRDPIVQDIQSQRKYESIIRPPAAIARSYGGFLSDETSAIQTQLSVASKEKRINSSPRIQMVKTHLIIPEPETTEVKTKIKLPAAVTSSLWTSSQHSTGRGNHLISLGRSTAQSLFINNPLPDNTMEISQSISQSVSGTQGIYKNSDVSSSQNRPYYLTSKKSYAFKGFTFFPTEQAPAQQTELHAGPKHPQSSLSNAFPKASSHPHTVLSILKEEKHFIQAQNPLIPNSLTKTHDKQFDQDPLSTNTLKHHRVVGQAMKASSSTSINTGPNNRAFYFQNNPKGGYNAAKESQSDKRPLETSQRTSERHFPAHNTQAFDKNQTVLSSWKSSLFNTTSDRSTHGMFARPNSYKNLFVKSSDVSSVSAKASSALKTYDSTVATGITNANTSPKFPSVYHKMGLSQGADFIYNIPTRDRNDDTVSLRPDKFNSVKNNPLSHVVPSIYRPTVTDKVTGYPFTLNAGVQPHSSDVQKNIKARDGLVIPTKKIKDAGGLTQINTNEMRVRPRSSVVTGRRVEANVEGKKSEKNSVYAVPTFQSTIYRSASIHQGNSFAKPVQLPTIHSSVIKPYGITKIFNGKIGQELLKNETRISVNRSSSGMDIDLSAVGVSQTLRPTNSFVVGKYVSVSDKNPSTSNLNAFRANGLQNFKPVRFADIAGSASFSSIKPSSSAVVSKTTFRSILNISTSTPAMDESFTDLPFSITKHNFPMITDLQENIEIDLQSKATTAVTTEPQPSFTEVSEASQTTVYSSELEPDPVNQTTPTAENIIPSYEEALIPNTTMLVTMTSD